MRHLILVAAVAVTLPMLAPPCFAGRADADACATKLPANAKLVYTATIGAGTPDGDLKEIVRTKTRALVMSGKLGRREARDAAEAAGVCLKQAR